MKVFVAAAAAAFVLAAPAGAVNGNEPVAAWVTDGSVFALAATPKQVYLGGDFTLIGRETGSWVGIDASGAVAPAPPVLYDQVDDAVSDGARGWFVLTEDSDGATSLVHLLADRSPDPKWHLTVNGSIEAIASHGRTLYVGGDFTKVNGARHARIAAIDVATRKPFAWDAAVSAKSAKGGADVTVLEVSPDGGTLYFAGDFAKVHDNKRAGMAAIAAA